MIAAFYDSSTRLLHLAPLTIPMSTPLYVIGHRNPDTDCICAAIGYAWYLREQGMDEAEAACCGEVNARTQFVLDEAGVPAPRLVMDVRPTIGRIMRREVVTACEDETLFEVYRRMQRRHIRAIPALDAAGNLLGLVTFSRLMELVLPDQDMDADSRRVSTSLARLAHVLGATFGNVVEPDRDEDLLVMVAAMSAKGFTGRMRKFPPEKLLIVTGDRPTVQMPAIDYGIRCLIVTGEYKLGDELLEMAQEKGVSVLYSPHDTATTTLLLRSAKVIRDAIQRDIRRIPESALVEPVARELQPSPQELFPVIDENGTLTGVFSKSDLVSPLRTRLILVDHNEFTQAVAGADQASILEVIDHHRLGGGLASREPIRFINEPVGSTCTIVTSFIHARHMSIPRDIGVCLAAGIISDTLHLTSPTTSGTDRRMLSWICSEIGLDAARFAERLFDAGSVLERYPARDAVRMDCKEYTEGEWRFAVAQIEELDLRVFDEHRAGLQDALDALVRDKNLDFAALMVTDITHHLSRLIIAGSERVRDAIDYPRKEDGSFELAGVVSRKKQLLPHIANVLARVTRA